MSRPPICDPACQKILLNGGSIIALSSVLRRRMKTEDVVLPAAIGSEITTILDIAEAKVRDSTGKHSNASDAERLSLIKELNHHENEVCRAHAMFLKAVGYTGEVGKMLE